MFERTFELFLSIFIPSMLMVTLHKNTPKPIVLRCLRADASETWSRLHPNTEYHDLAHIAIEKSLDLKQSFFGLIAAGYNISDFELTEDEKPQLIKDIELSEEAIITEHMVNLLMVERFNDGQQEAFIPQLMTILDERTLEFPSYLTENNLALVRSAYNQLIAQWQELPIGQSLETTILV